MNWILLFSFCFITFFYYHSQKQSYRRKGIESDILDKVGWAGVGACIWLGVVVLCYLAKTLGQSVWWALTT